MRTVKALAIVIIALLVSSVAPKADNDPRDGQRTGIHWDLVAALDYCRQLHELVVGGGRKEKNVEQLEELKDALAEEKIVTLMSVAIQINKSWREAIELRFWRDVSEDKGREIQVVLKLRRLGNRYEWDRVERIYVNRRHPLGVCDWVGPAGPRLPQGLPKDHWQRTSQGRWQGMVDLATTLAEFADAVIADDKVTLSRLSLFGVDSYPEVRTFRSAISNLSSATMEAITHYNPDVCLVTLKSRVHEFRLVFLATPSGWKYWLYGHSYLENQ